MRLPAIERKAREINIQDTWKYSKDDLIRKIQETEGNTPCFRNQNRKLCQEAACCWRIACIR